MCDPFVVIVFYECIMQEEADWLFAPAARRYAWQVVLPDDVQEYVQTALSSPPEGLAPQPRHGTPAQQAQVVPLSRAT